MPGLADLLLALAETGLMGKFCGMGAGFRGFEGLGVGGGWFSGTEKLWGFWMGWEGRGWR